MNLHSRASMFNKSVLGTLVTLSDNKTIETEEAMKRFFLLLLEKKKNKNEVFIIGNGGSSAVASHAVNDFLNVGKIKASSLQNQSVITCITNDYGYEQVYSRQLQVLFSEGDILVAISSSGESMNIVNAVTYAKQQKGVVITLSGFESDNKLRAMGNLNFWIDSPDYGIVEICHQFILHNISDRFF